MHAALHIVKWCIEDYQQCRNLSMSEQLKPIKLACMQAGRHSNVKLLECYPTSVDEADCGRIAGERSVSEGINDEHRQLIVAARRLRR
jgi:hypothetical protein